MSTKSLSHITVLKDDNFSDWLIDVRAHLRKHKLWKYTQEEAPKDTKDDGEWEEKAQDAADFMTPTISPAMKRKLAEAEFNNGYLMIKKLTDLLAPQGDAQFMRLTKEYYTLKADHWADIPAFLTHVKVLEERIDATKVDLTPDKRTILCLSMALPERYRSLVQMWSMTPDITAEKVRNMLLEDHRRELDHNKVDSNALVGKFGKQQQQAKSGNTKWCTTCETNTHNTQHCWIENPDLAAEWYRTKKNNKDKDVEKVTSRMAKISPFNPSDPYRENIAF